MQGYEIIQNNLRAKEVGVRVRLALGYGENDPAGKDEAHKYISSVLMEIQKTVGDAKRDLSVCTTESIIQSMIDAASFRLPIDGRKLAHLVKYGNKAQFQVGVRGYLYKIAEHYKDVDFTAEPIMEGDVFEVDDRDGFQSYTHKKANPLDDDMKNMRGIFACLSYSTKSGQRYQKVLPMAMSEVNKIRGKAKQDFIWSEWFVEKAKVAALKRLCKLHFATAQGLDELIQYDNRTNFDLEMKDATPAAAPTLRLENMLKGEGRTVLPVTEGDLTLLTPTNGEDNGQV